MSKDYQEAYKHSINHRESLIKDKVCGCFYCLSIFNPIEIEVWVPDTTGTALCPRCGMDAVIGESSGYPITPQFLRGMYIRFVGRCLVYGPNEKHEVKGRYYEKNDKELLLLRHSRISNLKSAVSFFDFTIEFEQDKDGLYAGSIEQIPDIVADGQTLEELRLKLAQYLVEYARDYYSEFNRYHNSPNRRSHAFYLIRVLFEVDYEAVLGMLHPTSKRDI